MLFTNSRSMLLIVPILALVSACGGEGVGNDGGGVPQAAEIPVTCLSDVRCVDDRDCAALAGTRCNTALFEPECQSVKCSVEGATCSEDALCPDDMTCLADRCGTCSDLPAGAVCVGGAPVCRDAAKTICGSKCVNLNTDPNHCGSCDNKVPSNSTCEAGFQCDPGLTACDGQCVDLMRNPVHCGACGQTLPAGVACMNGQPGCVGPHNTLCGDKCVNLLADDENCGACGTTCGGGTSSCSSGRCIVIISSQGSSCHVGVPTEANEMRGNRGASDRLVHASIALQWFPRHFDEKIGCSTIPSDTITCSYNSRQCLCDYNYSSCACADETPF